MAGKAKSVSIIVRADPAYRDWLNGLSKETLISSSSIVRDALAKWAAERGLPAPPSGPGSAAAEPPPARKPGRPRKGVAPGGRGG